MRSCVFFALFLIIGCHTTISAQAFAADDDAKMQQQLVAAVEALMGDGEAPLLFSGNVGEPGKAPDSKMVGNVQVRFETEVGDLPFRGNFEAASMAQGKEFAIVSKKELPAFAAFDNGQDIFQSLVFRGSPISGAAAASDLSQLINGSNLVKHLGRAKNITKKSGDAGETVYSCKLSNRLLRKATAGVSNTTLVGRVKNIAATVTIKNNQVQTMRFVVTRTHPFAAAGKDAISNIEVSPNQAAVAGIDMKALIRERFKDPKVAYDLTPIKALSQRSEKMIDQLRTIADAP